MCSRENVNRPELRDKIADYFHAGDQGVLVADLVDKWGQIKPADFTDEVPKSNDPVLQLIKSDQELCPPRLGDLAKRRVNGLEGSRLSPLRQA